MTRQKGKKLHLFAIAAAGSISAVLGFMGFLVISGTSLSREKAGICFATRCVALEKSGAKPSILKIKKGQSVQFNSADGNDHDLALGGGGKDHEHIAGAPHSGHFEADEAYKAVFKEVGTYKFHDHQNPSIYVTIVVE